MGKAEDLTTGTWTAGAPGAAEVEHVRTCRLDVVGGPDAGLSRTLGATSIRLGRAGTDLVLTDRKVSALHAEIRIEEGGYRLRDLGSSNGTFVNGMRVLDAYLQPGMRISLGDSTVLFAPLAGSVELPLFPRPELGGLIGRSRAMRRLFAEIDRVAAADATVLITGETGVGKELVAEAIHERSPRASGPFVVLDCGAVPRQLFEAQLYGYEAGAFTGALRRTKGIFEAADGGTVFLDEVGELPLELQTRLLRVVQTRSVRRLGGGQTLECDVRIVAATNRDLAVEVNRGGFRSDLFYRLAVVSLGVPALRDRVEDIVLLAEHFLAELRSRTNEPLPAEFLDWALKHGWPGNVRQLRNAVERAVTYGDWSTQAAGDAAVRESQASLEVDLAVPFRQAKQQLVDEFDRRYITALLAKHRGNVSAAARAADLDRMSIYKAIARLGIDVRSP